jgi:hypothetical protein
MAKIKVVKIFDLLPREPVKASQSKLHISYFLQKGKKANVKNEICPDNI